MKMTFKHTAHTYETETGTGYHMYRVRQDKIYRRFHHTYETHGGVKLHDSQTAH